MRDHGLSFGARFADISRSSRGTKPGDVVLVHTAAGGVGQILVQRLKHLEAIVIGTASNEEKLQTIRSLRADHPVNYAHGTFLKAVLDLTGGRVSISPSMLLERQPCRNGDGLGHYAAWQSRMATHQESLLMSKAS